MGQSLASPPLPLRWPLQAHVGQTYWRAGGRETPCQGNFSVLIEWRQVLLEGDSRRGPGAYPAGVSSTAPHKIFAARPGTRALIDVAIGAAALAGSLALLRHGFVPSRPGSGQLDPISVVLTACSTVPLVAWRRSPLGVFAVTAVAGVLLAGLGYSVDLLLGPAAAVYLLAASRDPEIPWTWHTTFAVVGLLLAFLGAAGAAQLSFPGLELLHTGMAWAVAWFAGERTRLRRERVAELGERALRAEREAERERLLAVAEERARIARDLHDSAGHAINVIAVRAGAARLRHHHDPDRSLQALRQIEEVARQTAGEIDEIVGNLRQGSAHGTVEAPPGLASLDTLISHHEAAGLEVTLETVGAPRPLRGAADRAAYRILQEALTNAARHGTGRARIDVAYGDRVVELTVSNPVPAHRAPRSGGGHGLIGMRERASLLGGNLDAGQSNGAFLLRAQIPYRGHRA